MTRLRSALGALSLLLLAACGGGKGPTPEGVAVVQVQNRNPSTVEVWAAGEGGRLRLGTVLPQETNAFGVPASLVSRPPYRLQLSVGPVGVGREAYNTPPLSLRPGSRVQLTIEPRLESSRMSVKR